MKRDTIVVTPDNTWWAVCLGRLEEANMLSAKTREEGRTALRERFLGQAPLMTLVLVTGGKSLV